MILFQRGKKNMSDHEKNEKQKMDLFIVTTTNTTKKKWTKPTFIIITKEELQKHIRVAARSTGGGCGVGR